jgi:transposase-like protein
LSKSCSNKGAAVKLSKKRLDTLTSLLGLDVCSLIKEELDGYLMQYVRLMAQVLMNTEVVERVGRRYEHNSEREAVRWGSQPSGGYLLGQRVSLERPRVRSKDGRCEIELDTAKLLGDPTVLSKQMATKLLSGVSTRRVPDVIEGLLSKRGIGRQTVSRRGIEIMAKRLDEFKRRKLHDLGLVVILVDGIGIGNTLHVVAVGIDSCGKKHVLGMKPGQTEDHVVCQELLADLIERGLSDVGGYLFVIDGGKGLRKAIRAFYGNRVAVQRCLEHKKRNLEKYVPKDRRDEVRQKMNSAYASESLGEAQAAFDQLRRQLLLFRGSAANSLLEGLGELLTLHKLGVDGVLRRTLCTTNSIESVFSSARYYMRNVKRWRTEEDSERWLAAGLLEAERRLRPVPGYTRLTKLKQTLEKLASAT